MILLRIYLALINIVCFISHSPEKNNQSFALKANDSSYGIVHISVCNLRSRPTHPSELSTQVLMGNVVKILQRESEDNWYQVVSSDNYKGWVDPGGLIQVTKKEAEAWVKSEKIIYTKHFGFSYSQTDIHSQTVSDLVIGDILGYRGKTNQFVKVEYPDGRLAFIPESDCELFADWLSKCSPTPENITKTAKTFLGFPYLWGGTSSKGLDCSGFTKTVYYLNGVILPRDASQQVQTGEPVDTQNGFENLQPGDLLFFGKDMPGKTPTKITHVALYIGNMEYIHSSGSIKINSLDRKSSNFSEFRLTRFVKAKRILNSLDKNGISTLHDLSLF